MIKPTVVIAFNGGVYGTYLEWCLTTLTTNANVRAPFNRNGNSHQFIGNHLLNMQGWRDYVGSDEHHQFVRVHPKTSSTETINTNLLEIAGQSHRLIYLYPDQATLLLCLNNFFYKVWNNWMTDWFQKLVPLQNLYNNWPMEPDTPVDQIPVWILREFLSYYLMPAWFDQIDWYSPPWQHPKSITVTVSELLFEFEPTLDRVLKFCDLECQQSISILQSTHQENLTLQAYIDHDRLCNSIVDSIVTNSDFSWSRLSLPSEAWVQWQLRNLGYEIRCNGLDMFPTNSLQLQKLLYSI